MQQTPSDDLDDRRKPAAAVNDIRAEKADRIEAAEKAAAEMSSYRPPCAVTMTREPPPTTPRNWPSLRRPRCPSPVPVTAYALVKQRLPNLFRVRHAVGADGALRNTQPGEGFVDGLEAGRGGEL